MVLSRLELENHSNNECMSALYPVKLKNFTRVLRLELRT